MVPLCRMVYHLCDLLLPKMQIYTCTPPVCTTVAIEKGNITREAWGMTSGKTYYATRYVSCRCSLVYRSPDLPVARPCQPDSGFFREEGN